MATQAKQRARRKTATSPATEKSGLENSGPQQERRLPPQEQQERRAKRSTQPGVELTDQSRTDVEGSTESSAGSDFSGSGEETDERLHQQGIDEMTHGQRQGDGKINVQTQQQPKYHSGKQTQR